MAIFYDTGRGNMNTDTYCPDCGAEFDASVPVMKLPGMDVFRCDDCGHLIYQLTWDQDTWGEMDEEE